MSAVIEILSPLTRSLALPTSFHALAKSRRWVNLGGFLRSNRTRAEGRSSRQSHAFHDRRDRREGPDKNQEPCSPSQSPKRAVVRNWRRLAALLAAQQTPKERCARARSSPVRRARKSTRHPRAMRARGKAYGYMPPQAEAHFGGVVIKREIGKYERVRLRRAFPR